MDELLLVLCTFPDGAKARQIGTTLVEMQLAACVNLIPGVESIYRWEGKVEQSTEVLGLFKTIAANYPLLEQALLELHPYEVPEVVVLHPHMVEARYLSWALGALAGAADAGKDRA